MAAFLLQDALTQMRLSWHVDSAGTAAIAGEPVHPRIREVLGEIGLEIAPHTARQITAGMVDRSNLILTATVDHRRAIVGANVSALNKTFTLRQFARLCSVVLLQTTDAQTLGADLIKGARLARSRFQPAQPGEDDVEDPMGGRLRQYRACRDTIAMAVDAIARPLAESPAVTSPAGSSPVTQTADSAMTVPSPTAVRRRGLRYRALLPRRP
jgi:protein-tyrosine phosphatase